MRIPIGRAGESVTCENGHEVMRVLRDLHRGTQIRAGDFESVRDDYEIVRGTLIAPCSCGKRVVRWSPSGGVQIHFADGWR